MHSVFKSFITFHIQDYCEDRTRNGIQITNINLLT